MFVYLSVHLFLNLFVYLFILSLHYLFLPICRYKLYISYVIGVLIYVSMYIERERERERRMCVWLGGWSKLSSLCQSYDSYLPLHGEVLWCSCVQFPAHNAPIAPLSCWSVWVYGIYQCLYVTSMCVCVCMYACVCEGVGIYHIPYTYSVHSYVLYSYICIHVEYR